MKNISYNLFFKLCVPSEINKIHPDSNNKSSSSAVINKHSLKLSKFFVGHQWNTATARWSVELFLSSICQSSVSVCCKKGNL